LLEVGGRGVLRDGKENETWSEDSEDELHDDEENVEVGDPRGTKDDAEGLSRKDLGVDGREK
jgi:hypothetical protein